MGEKEIYIPVIASHRAGGDEIVSLAMGTGATACACSGAGGKRPPEAHAFPLLSVDEVIALERRVEAAGTSLLSLMNRAGESLASFAMDAFSPGSRILVLCGSGNNGGDGWVAARKLADSGYAVTVLALRAPADITTEPARTAALQAMEGLRECESPTLGVEEPSLSDGCAEGCEIVQARCVPFAACGSCGSPDTDVPFAFSECDAIVDCLLGTGFGGGTVKDPCRRLIQRANETRAFRIACDVPSGMNAQTGEVRDVCFHANATVTMIAVKTGIATREAEQFVGRLLLAPLDISIE